MTDNHDPAYCQAEPCPDRDAYQLARDLELNQKTAWYMNMRIGRALADVSTMLQGIHGIDLTKWMLGPCCREATSTLREFSWSVSYRTSPIVTFRTLSHRDRHHGQMALSTEGTLGPVR